MVLMLGVLAACGAQRAVAPAPNDDASTSLDAVIPGEDADKDISEDSSGEVSLVPIGRLNQPVDAASRAGDAAVYFVSRTGTIHRFINDAFERQPVLDVSDLTQGEGERGLLGLAFALDGTTAYLNYTNLAGDTVVAELRVDSTGRFDRSSLRTLLTIPQPYRNHNAGDLVVEPAGTLLVPMGDGGSANDPLRASLDPTSLQGKVLRLDPRSLEVSVVAKGLRNPWRVDLHDDRLWLADVGQNEWEEVSVLDDVSQRAGVSFDVLRSSASANESFDRIIDFGWSAFEGNVRFNDDQSSNRHTPPVLVYRHGEDGCSISGGAVATGGSLRGRYVFADYCSGRVWSIPADTASPSVESGSRAADESSAEKTLHFTNLDTPSAVVRANDDLYVLSLGGAVWRLDG